MVIAIGTNRWKTKDRPDEPVVKVLIGWKLGISENVVGLEWELWICGS
jgi:hypothetical protein